MLNRRQKGVPVENTDKSHFAVNGIIESLRNGHDDYRTGIAQLISGEIAKRKNRRSVNRQFRASMDEIFRNISVASRDISRLEESRASRTESNKQNAQSVIDSIKSARRTLAKANILEVINHNPPRKAKAMVSEHVLYESLIGAVKEKLRDIGFNPKE